MNRIAFKKLFPLCFFSFLLTIRLSFSDRIYAPHRRIPLWELRSIINRLKFDNFTQKNLTQNDRNYDWNHICFHQEKILSTVQWLNIVYFYIIMELFNFEAMNVLKSSLEVRMFSSIEPQICHIIDCEQIQFGLSQKKLRIGRIGCDERMSIFF